MPFDSISAVLPAYDEEENIEKATRDMAAVLASLALRDWEVIVVDDGSRDRTGEICDRLAAEDPQHVRVNQFDVKEMTRLLPLIEDADIVCGFRIYRFDPLTRLILSWGFNLLVRIMFRIPVRDIDCAFKLFRREVFDKVTIESKKFFVDAEVLAKARYYGFRLVEIGVRHYPRPAGRSTVRASHIFSTLRELAHIWRNIYLRPRSK